MLTRSFQVFALPVALIASASFSATAQDHTMPAQPYRVATEHGIEALPSEADHEAAAERFEAEAAEFEKQAAEHDRITAQYHQSRSNPRAYYQSLAEHCDRLAKNLRAAAAEAREMAHLHRKVLKVDHK
jgi:hypothetical protein